MNRIGNITQLICTLLYVMTTHAICIYCSVYPQLPPVIGAPWGCCGHASGIYFPRPLWFNGCATHATPCSVPEYSYFRMCLEKSERNCLTSYLYNAAILASVFLFACLRLHFTRLFPDPRLLLFVLQNIQGFTWTTKISTGRDGGKIAG